MQETNINDKAIGCLVNLQDVWVCFCTVPYRKTKRSGSKFRVCFVNHAVFFINKKAEKYNYVIASLFSYKIYIFWKI